MSEALANLADRFCKMNCPVHATEQGWPHDPDCETLKAAVRNASARIKGDKDRENPVERPHTDHDALARLRELEAKATPGPWLRIDKADYGEIHAQFRPSSPAVALVGKPDDIDAIVALRNDAMRIIEQQAAEIARKDAALQRIQSLAERCETLPDTDGFRRAYRDIDVMARAALKGQP